MSNFEINSLTLLEVDEVINRPRVSYEVREYVWSYIYINILEPRNLLKSQKYKFSLTVSVKKFDPKIHKYFTDSPYNDDQNKFRPETKFRVFEKTKKIASIGVLSTYGDLNISPTDYANLLYDAFGSFLVNVSKKLNKEIMDEFRSGLDHEFINSFEFPAPFDQQKYIGDNSAIDGVWINEIYEKNLKEELKSKITSDVMTTEKSKSKPNSIPWWKFWQQVCHPYINYLRFSIYRIEEFKIRYNICR